MAPASPRYVYGSDGRTHVDYGFVITMHSLSDLVGELSTPSEAFRTWWAAHWAATLDQPPPSIQPARTPDVRDLHRLMHDRKRARLIAHGRVPLS